MTKPDRYPLPNLIDAVYSLRGNKYFTTIDLVRGYYQVEIDENSRELTAFSTPHSHYQFKKLPFGLKNAPSAFQREINAILQDFPWSKVVTYIDDILIMEESLDKHLMLIEKVLKTLLKFGIKVKPEKCEWVKESVEFLGHIIGQDGVRKSPKYMQDVENVPHPETVEQLQGFLGLIGFQRKFIPNCSTLQKPLSILTSLKKKSRIEWNAERLKAFDDLKQAIRQDTELAYPDYSHGAASLELSVDASAVGAGACLAQTQKGSLRPIGFASMTFTPAQRAYATIERELAALQWGVKYFRAFLYGVQFVINTDHRPLVYLHNMKMVDSRLARTLEDLGDFSFTIQFVPGKMNSIADGLSRIPSRESENSEYLETLPVGLELDGLPIPGGGDSLFEALHRVITNNVADRQSPSDQQGLREILIDELSRNPVYYGLTDSKELRKESRCMKGRGQLPFVEVLLAASVVYRIVIKCHFFASNPVVYQYGGINEENCSAVVHLQCLGGVHYNALKNNEDTSPDIIEEPGNTQYLGELPLETNVSCCIHDNLNAQGGYCKRCQLSVYPWIECKIGEISCCGVLDTGSEISIVRKSLINDCQDNIKCHNVDGRLIGISGFTGKTTSTSAWVSLEIFLGDGFESYSHAFAVIDDELLPHCMILGCDFIVKHKLSINFAPGIVKQCISGEPSVELMAPCFSANALHIMPARPYENKTISMNHNVELPLIEKLTPFLIKDVQKDPIIATLKEVIHVGYCTKDWPEMLKQFKRYGSILFIENDVLIAKGDESRVVVSFEFLVKTVTNAHLCMAHISREKLLDVVKRYIWHPEVTKVVSDVCLSCTQCQLLKVGSQRIRPPMLKIESCCPFGLVAIDLVQFPRIPRGNIGCLTLVDHYSKWLSMVPIKDKSARTICEILQHRIFPALPKIPTRLMSDNGPEFAAEVTAKMLEAYNIKHIFTTPYKPSSNGCVERLNRTITEFLRSLTETAGMWDMSLSQAIITYNNTKHAETKRSPSECLLEKAHKAMPENTLKGGNF